MDTTTIVLFSVITLYLKHYWCLELTANTADPLHSLSSFDLPDSEWLHDFDSSYTAAAKLVLTTLTTKNFRNRKLACLSPALSSTGDSFAKALALWSSGYGGFNPIFKNRLWDVFLIFSTILFQLFPIATTILLTQIDLFHYIFITGPARQQQRLFLMCISLTYLNVCKYELKFLRVVGNMNKKNFEYIHA